MPMYSETADPLCIHGCMSLSHLLQGLSRDAATQTLSRSSFPSSSFLPLNMNILNSVFDTIMPRMTLGAIADASLTAATLLWTPEKDLGAPVQKQKRIAIALSAVCLASLAASITNVHLSSTASLLASVAVLGHTLSCSTVSDGTAFLNIARAILMVVFSVPRLNICLLTSALSHLAIAWYMLIPSTQREIHRYMRYVLGFDTLARLRLYSKNDLSDKDMHSEEGIQWTLRGIEKLQLDTSKTYFVLRGFLAFAWKRMLSLAIIDLVFHLCIYYKDIVFVMIVGAVDQNSRVEGTEILVLCAMWSALSTFSAAYSYHWGFKAHIYWEILDVFRIKVIGIKTSRNGGQLADEEYNRTHSVDLHEMVCGIRNVVSVLSQSVASFLSIRLLISKVGWHAALPVAFMIVFSIARSLVTAKLEALEKLSKAKVRPRFYTNLDILLRNMSTVKFYGWEQAFQRVRGYPDRSRYVSPLFWRIVNYIVTLVGSSATQLATALTVASYLQSSWDAGIY
ncbi:hypothetical protein DL89DRAFT_89609 [Linderina pennispora]|uniref:Uncharacterized protein n=1 Tax=Linderina pennispora TaxID=61395 RepID=A0A1Y1WIJ2_9FUNG|nr:uncharacterized protein DL89DRAFT_89609 [Linderina pennispora]ORX73185.1 hypothetical protein DL89DRAFT_89609 [Linderina pennispora]